MRTIEPTGQFKRDFKRESKGQQCRTERRPSLTDCSASGLPRPTTRRLALNTPSRDCLSQAHHRSQSSFSVYADYPKFELWSEPRSMYGPGTAVWSGDVQACSSKFCTLSLAKQHRRQLESLCKRNQSVFPCCCLGAWHLSTYFEPHSTSFVRIPLMADTVSTFIADSIPYDGGHPAQVS